MERTSDSSGLKRKCILSWAWWDTTLLQQNYGARQNVTTLPNSTTTLPQLRKERLACYLDDQRCVAKNCLRPRSIPTNNATPDARNVAALLRCLLPKTSHRRAENLKTVTTKQSTVLYYINNNYELVTKLVHGNARASLC